MFSRTRENILYDILCCSFDDHARLRELCEELDRSEFELLQSMEPYAYEVWCSDIMSGRVS
jgi:hypothetical protein